MRVAALQFKPDKTDRATSQGTLLAMIREAGEHGARLIVCPEMALSGYLFEDAEAVAEVAEPADGGTFLPLAELAARYRATLVCGYPEVTSAPEDGEPVYYNSARIIGPDGALVYNYRKRLLYDSDFSWAVPGDTEYPLLPGSADEFSPLCAGICMDLNDDRFTDFLHQRAPRVIAFCTNWLDEGVDVLPYWRYRLRRVPAFFVAANTYGTEQAPGHPPCAFCGGSAILAPGGRLLSRAPKHGDAVVLADL